MERLLALACSSKKSRSFRRSAGYDGMGLDGIWVMLEATVELGRGSAPG
jgi:hypothetical protein